MLGSSFSSAVRKILKVIPFFYCHLEFSFPNERLPKILNNLIINIGYFWLFLVTLSIILWFSLQNPPLICKYFRTFHEKSTNFRVSYCLDHDCRGGPMWPPGADRRDVQRPSPTKSAPSLHRHCEACNASRGNLSLPLEGKGDRVSSG